MNLNQRKIYVGTIEESLRFLGNQIFAELSQIVLESMTNVKLERRGQTVSGEAVGHIVDSNSANFKLVAEYSCEKDYFADKKLEKIKKDIRHCLSIAPDSEEIYLLANTSCGPKKYTKLTNLLTRYGKCINKKIDFFDGRLISEYIVDEIIDKQDNLSIEKLIHLIPSIKQIKQENNYTNSLPSHSENYIQRETDEKEITKLLSKNKFAQLYGISGIGKTYLAVKLANDLLESDWNSIWISGKDVKDSNDLLSLGIDRYGVPQNIVGLMSRFKTFLIIDGLESNIDEIINYILGNVQNDFRLIVTSQIEARLESKYNIKHLGKELSLKILNQNLTNKCPDDVLLKIIDTLGGHPFILNQINVLIANGDLQWSDIPTELEYIPASEDEGRQPYFNKLFGNHLKSLSKELECLKWISSKNIEQSFLKSMIGITGISKLESRDFFNISNKTQVILHDIVIKSLSMLQLDVNSEALENKFSNVLESFNNDYNPNYYRIIHTHQDLIFKIFKNSKTSGIFSYSYLQSVKLEVFDDSLFHEFSDNEIEHLFLNYKEEYYFKILSWIEYVEVCYRHIKLNQEYNKIKEYLEPIITRLIELVNTSKGLPQNVILDIKNHIGKFQRNIGDNNSAQKTFEDILKINSSFWAAKFHLSKLFRKSNAKLAKEMLSEILNSYENATNISSTIVLASYKEIRSHKGLDNIFMTKFISSFSNLINETMVHNFDLPYEVLGALSSRIAFNYPEKLIILTESIPIPSENTVDNKTLFDVGQIYFNISKAYLELDNQEKSVEYANQSIAYYEKLSSINSFQRRFIAETYILVPDISKALHILLEVPSSDREIWWNYTYSKTLRLNGEYPQAIEAINECFALKPYDKTVFYRERALIKKAMNDEDFKEDYKLALENSKPGKFQDMINEEIKSS